MTTMTSMEALVEILRREGVEYVFGLPGSTELAFLYTLQKHPEIKYIPGLQEGLVVAMAEGYSRASGKVAVCSLHEVPGPANAMGMLSNAYRAGAPLVIIAGQRDSRTLMQQPEYADITTMVSQWTKWSTRVSNAADIPIAIRRAFKIATQHPTGPVFVSMPQNPPLESIDFEYLPSSLSSTRRRPDREAIARVVELLLNAETLAIIVGSGVAKHEATAEAVKLAELTKARVYDATRLGNMNFPTTHPQYLGLLGDGKGVLQYVDTLVAIGAVLFEHFLPGPLLLRPGTKLIQVENDPWEIGKNFPAVGLEGDIKLSLAELNDDLQKVMSTRTTETASQREEAREAWLKKGQEERDKAKQIYLKKAQSERENVPISVSRLMQDLGECLKPGSVVVDDAGTSSGALRRHIHFTEPKSYFAFLGSGGSLGWGVSASPGIKLALPDRPVVGVLGDGSAIFFFQSLWTAAHCNIPVTFIICANASYQTVKSNMVQLMGEQAKGKFLGMELDKPRIDFCQLAQAMGVPGQKVERPGELKEVLTSALNSGKPGLVEVAISDAI